MFWIVGAHGMLGTYVLRQAAGAGIPAVGSDRDVDIGDEAAVRAFARGKQVSAILNCAAFTDVRACETAEPEAFAVNAGGVLNLARAAEEAGARLVHVSTDYVFDGRSSEPYGEEAEPRPLNAYGRSKAAGEAHLMHASCPWTLVRTAWLFGGRGRNFVTAVVSRLRREGTMQVVDDQVGCPTFAKDLAEALVALARAEPGVYHFVNAGAVSWYGFAREIARVAAELELFASPPLVTAVSSAAFNDPVTRPAYSVLSTEKVASVLGRPPRPWPEALREYLTGWAEERPPGH